jgi:serine protease Do
LRNRKRAGRAPAKDASMPVHLRMPAPARPQRRRAAAVVAMKHARRWSAACALAALLSACALPAVPLAGGQLRHPGFGPALARALPSVIGVHGVGRCVPQAMGAPDARDLLLPPLDAEGEPARDDEPEDADPGQIGAGFLLGGTEAVTAAHVVAGCPRVVVVLADRRVAGARVLGADADLDIALLQVDAPPAAAPALGRPAVLLAGDWVLAVGQPYGLARSVSAGVVAGKDRHFVEEPEGLYLQTDLALNPGNSGGPLLDAAGRIVGMNVRTVIGLPGTSAVGLSIPIEIVLQVVEELRRPPGPQPAGLQRARLGAAFEDVLPQIALAAGRAYADGARITSVEPGSLAQRMGLQRHDIVVGWNGRAIGSAGDLARALTAWRGAPGSRATVFRAGTFSELMLPASPPVPR